MSFTIRINAPAEDDEPELMALAVTNKDVLAAAVESALAELTEEHQRGVVVCLTVAGVITVITDGTLAGTRGSAVTPWARGR